MAGTTTSELRVLMVGDDLAHPGGIATYQRRVMAGAPPDVSVRHVPTNVAGSAWRKLRVFARGWWAVRAAARHGDADIVQVCVSDGGSIIRKGVVVATVRRAGVPVVLHTNSAEPWKPYPGRRVLEPWALRGLGRADVGVALTEHWAAWFREHWPLPAWVVVPNPAPQLRPSSPDPDGPLVIVKLGRLGERKGTSRLLEAYAALPATLREGTRVVLAGDGEVEQARALAASLGVADRVEVPGWLDSETRDALLARASVFVLPSRAEGQPLAVLEALAAGLAVVTTDIAGMDELITDGEDGLLVPPEDGEALRAALERVIAEPELRERLRAGASARAADLGVERHWDRLLEVYERALAGTARSSSTQTQRP